MAWKLTDDASCQYIKRLESNILYELVEILYDNPGQELYGVYTDKVNVDYYIKNLKDELKHILNIFGYESVDEVRNEYRNHYKANQIIAECIFEHYGSFQAESIFTGTEEECATFIKDYIKKTNEIWYRADYADDMDSEYYIANNDEEAIEYAKEIAEVKYADIGIVHREVGSIYEVDDNSEFFNEIRLVY
jgi:hypothetical protein